MKYARDYHFHVHKSRIVAMWLDCPWCGGSISIDQLKRDQAHACPICGRVFVECLPEKRRIHFTV